MGLLLLAIIYLAFIGLGVPDAVLGATWPIISTELSFPLAHMGYLTLIIAGGTIFSSLFSYKWIHRFGVCTVTSVSIATTAVAMWGFSLCESFFAFCLWAIPYGVGAGCVDAALNNYVAVHYESRHMSWLHCMWGLGATLGPYIMSFALLQTKSWQQGYIYLFFIQVILVLIVVCSRTLWTKNDAENEENEENKTQRPIKELIKMKAVPQILIAFFFFCALEQTSGLWASSYFVYAKGISPETATSWTALFYLGITIGRGIGGFLTMKYSDIQMVRAGCVIMLIGICFLSYGPLPFLIIGLGSSPVYPAIIHSTPIFFNKTDAQAIIGLEMASAYTGNLIIPFLFGHLANFTSVKLYPWYVLFLLGGLVYFYEKVIKLKKGELTEM
ncbi:MAG: MFS transporter [Bacillota bacterium]